MFNDLVTCDILTWFSFLLVLVAVTWLITSTRVPAHIPIDNKSILITGCDSGFGHELAIKATARGFHVFACCLSQWSDGAASLVAKDCTVIEVDVTQQKTLDAALPVVEEVLASRGLVLHGVVNNAGLNLSLGPVEWVAPETIQKIFDVNTVGVVRVTRTFLPLVRKARVRSHRQRVQHGRSHCQSWLDPLLHVEGGSFHVHKRTETRNEGFRGLRLFDFTHIL